MSGEIGEREVVGNMPTGQHWSRTPLVKTRSVVGDRYLRGIIIKRTLFTWKTVRIERSRSLGWRIGGGGEGVEERGWRIGVGKDVCGRLTMQIGSHFRRYDGGNEAVMVGMQRVWRMGGGATAGGTICSSAGYCDAVSG